MECWRWAALGWSRRGSGLYGANSMERAKVGQAKGYGVGVRFIVKVFARGDLKDVADVSLSPASYESEAVGKQFGVRSKTKSQGPDVPCMRCRDRMHTTCLSKIFCSERISRSPYRGPPPPHAYKDPRAPGALGARVAPRARKLDVWCQDARAYAVPRGVIIWCAANCGLEGGSCEKPASYALARGRFLAAASANSAQAAGSRWATVRGARALRLNPA